MRNALIVAAASCSLAGCVSHDATSSVSPASEERSLVQLEVVYTRTSAETIRVGRVGLDAAAHFVRYRTADAALDARAVSTLLGLQHDDDLAAGSCRAVDDTQVASGRASSLDIALLDAGSLTVRNAGVVEAVLAPQHYPELLPFVSGVVYGEEGTLARAPAPSARIEIEADGGEDVGPFVTSATMPRAFPELVVARTGQGVELSWAALPNATVLVDLRWGGVHAGSVRCRAVDDGRFVVARAVARASLPVAARIDEALAQGAQVAASVSRSEQASLDAPGVGAGRLLVTLRDTATISQ